jgi:hypothetical protein
MIVPTLADSTIAHGMHWSVFLIRATTAIPVVYFDSAPDSGYSLDNLVPKVPQNLMADGRVDKVILTWDPNEEEDFDYYAVYRDTLGGSDPREPIGYTTVEYYEDVDLPGPGDYWYRVTACDFSGNESKASLSAGVYVTEVSNPPPVPTVTTLEQNIPNPFNPVTVIRFGIAKPEWVQLVVYDVGGRPVRVLVEGRREASMCEVTWDGRDDSGQPVTSGVYLYSLKTGDFVATRKMVMLR